MDGWVGSRHRSGRFVRRGPIRIGKESVWWPSVSEGSCCDRQTRKGQFVS